MPQQWKPQSCLCFHISCEYSLDISRLDSTNGSARGPHSCLGREVQNQMLHRQEKARWKDLLQLTEQQRCHFFQLNHFHRYLLGTKLAEEKAQLCQHLPDMLRDIASDHHRKKPLNSYVVVMTLHPVDSQSA